MTKPCSRLIGRNDHVRRSIRRTELFPSETTDPRWNSAKRQQVATELNRLNTFAHDAAGTAQAFTFYRGLSADALRVLAGLPGNEAAFTQLTTAPLDPEDHGNANHRGPDDPDSFQIGDPNNPLASLSLQAFTDTVDGLISNRQLYRVAYVDAAHNPSALSLAGAPVFTIDVVAPNKPVLLAAIGGKNSATVQWLANTEADLDFYLLYDVVTAEAAQDVNTMILRKQIAKSPTATPRPGEALPAVVIENGVVVPNRLQFVDPVEPNIQFYYRLVAVDVSGNRSEPSDLVSARAFQLPPSRPTLATPVWDSGHHHVMLSWTASSPNLQSRVERRVHGGALWLAASDWLIDGHYTLQDTPPSTATVFDYRVRMRDALGQVSVPSALETTT